MEKSLDNIIKTYLIKELQHQRPEKENGHSRKVLSDKNEPDEGSDEDYIHALHECLEKKGILRELQTFLRQKMVLILQDKWPNLVESSALEIVSPTTIKLIEDFLCSRRLLYTYSVLCSELGLRSSGKVNWGKMPCRDAEILLNQMDIKEDSELSRRILKFYFEEDHSLLECILRTTIWSDSNAKTDPSENERFLQPSIESQSKQLSVRLRLIDEHYDRTKRINKEMRNLSADQRFHEIERFFEDQKKDQLQMAIAKFKEEEVERIKEEMEHRMKFEMLAKENELLVNYKEKATILKENLEREKAIWLAEKSQEQREIEEKRKELESMITAVAKTKDDDVPLSPKTPAETDSPPRQRVKVPEKFDATDAKLIKHYENVDEFLMREAELRVAVKRLREENAILLIEKERACQEKHQQIAIIAKPVQIEIEPEKPSQTSSVQKVDTDKIAFLQYNLEQQAEEIKRLKQQLYLDSQKPKPSSPIPRRESHDSKDLNEDLIHFLAESKRRCEEIEEDARNVDRKFHEIQTRRSRSSSPAYQTRRFTRPPSVFQAPPNTAPEPLVQPHTIRAVSNPMPSPTTTNITMTRTLPFPFDESFWIANPPNSTSMSRADHSPPQTTVTKEHSMLNNDRTQERLETAISPTKSTASNSKVVEPRMFPTKLPEITEERSPRKKSDSGKLERAVRKGALSFEKISSDGESSLSSSIRQESSRSRSRSLKNLSNAQRAENHGTQKTIPTDPATVGVSEDKLTPENSPGKVSEQEDATGEEKSLSIANSAVYDISHGGGGNVDDDEFWKI